MALFEVVLSDLGKVGTCVVVKRVVLALANL